MKHYLDFCIKIFKIKNFFILKFYSDLKFSFTIYTHKFIKWWKISYTNETSCIVKWINQS